MPNYTLKSINTPALPEFQNWTDEFGMVTDNSEGSVSGNGNLYTAHYILGLDSNKLLNPQEIKRVNQVYSNNMPAYGILDRAPNKQEDRESVDDFIGLISADKIMNKDRAITKSILNRGKQNVYSVDSSDNNKKNINFITFILLFIVTLGNVKNVWNNVNFNKFHVSSWLGRRREFVANMKLSLGQWINPFDYVYWTLFMLSILVGNSHSNDAYILRFHMAISCQDSGPVTGYICKLVKKKINAKFGNFGALLRAYFNRDDHPLIKLCNKVL